MKTDQTKAFIVRCATFAILSLTFFGSTDTIKAATLDGELRKWHRVALTFDGPMACEDDEVNPFLDYRLTVTFTNGAETYEVPGFFAADGEAAQTSASCGDKWRVYFTPDKVGTWNWTAEFRSGSNIAVSTLAGGSSSFDGATGSFDVTYSNKPATDFRAKGRLTYKNRRYLKFQQSKEYFLMSGAGSPENFLAYQEFDNTYNDGGTDYIKTYFDHINDWEDGDPTWDDGLRGKGIIGAVNYLATQGVNSQYFLTFNEGGDGDDVWPWVAPDQYDVFDVSKLDQWGIVFEHMDHLGIVKHFITQEQENDQYINLGDLGIERKLYYRELVARYSYLNGVIWNLGEENTNTTAQREDYAHYLRSIDPYGHHIQTHTYTWEKDDVYTPLLGNTDFTGASLQVASTGWVGTDTEDWVVASEAAGHPWVVFMSEIGPASEGVVPDAIDPDHNKIREGFLWKHLLHGGSGVEWYFGYDYAQNDLDCENFRSRENMWSQTKIALDFMQQIPFHRMNSYNDLVSRWDTYCFALPGRLYVVHLPNGDGTDLTLEESGHYFLGWFDPRTGGDLINVTTFEMTGPGTVSLDALPTEEDWIAVVYRHSSAADPGMRIASQFGELSPKGSVSPNPVVDKATLKLGFWEEGSSYRVEVMDMNGRVVRNTLNTTDRQIQLDLGGLPEGLYLYRVHDGLRETETGTLVKVRP